MTAERATRRWWRRRLALLVGLASGYGLLNLACHIVFPPALHPAGCEIIHADGLCELRDDTDYSKADAALRIWLDAPSVGEPVTYAGWHRLAGVEVHHGKSGGLLARVPVPAGASRITFLSFHNLHFHWSTLRVSPPRSSPWLLEARRLWHHDHVDEALAVLAKHKAETPRDQALAASLLANIHIERSRLAEAERLLREALAVERRTDLESSELDDALNLSSLLGQNLRRFDEAARVLRERKALFERFPHRKALRSLQLAMFLQMRGEYVKALRTIEEGIPEAERFEERFVRGELFKLKAEILEELGRTRAAFDVLKSAEDKDLPACRKANLIDHRAWLLVFALEASRDGSVAGTDRDPRLTFREALAVREHCNDKVRIAHDWTGHARTDILLKDIDLAEQDLAMARKSVPDQADVPFQIEWLDLSGQIALARGRWRAAEEIYRELQALANTAPSVDDEYGTKWRAWIGLGQAREADRPEEALDAYRRAEDYLDARGKELPLHGGRGGFLGRHEYGTALHVELLVRLGRAAEALLVARHARVRGLLAFANLARMASWSDGQREAWRAKLEEYGALRRALESVEAQRADVAEDERIALAVKAGQLREKLDALAADALHLGASIVDIAPRPAETDEVVIGCHTARSGWLCFAESGAKVEAVRLAGFDEAGRRSLVAAFAPMLRTARRLRVLAFGASRQIDFEALPFNGSSLGEWLDVRYGVDVAGAPRSEPSPAAKPPSLLVLDPDNGIPETRAVMNEVPPLLEARFDVHLVRGVNLIVGRPGKSGPTDGGGLDDPEWQSRLSAADLFLYYGHGGHDLSGGPALMIDAIGFNTSDILTLARVPPWIVLVACGGGLSEEETGGLERVGVAQAFLLRGSHWVIAPVRNVNVEVGAELALALVQAGVDRAGADPVKALREARRRVRSRLIAGPFATRPSVLADSLDAFRVFVL